MTKYKAVWSDGYITFIIKENNIYRLEGNKRSFDSLISLSSYYKGTIKSIIQVLN